MTRKNLHVLLALAGVAALSPAAFAQVPPDEPDPMPEPADPPETEPAPMADPPPVEVDVDVETHVPPPPPVETDIDVQTTDPALTGDPTYTYNQTYRTDTIEEEPALSRMGFALSLGGGVTGFTDDTARATTQDGGGWEVRATFGTRMPLAAEVSYLGSAQTIDALGLDNDAILVGNGVQANARLNLTTDMAVQPFLFLGAAWRRYDLTRTDVNTSDIADFDNVLEIPVGAGLSFRYRGFIVDARGEYRAATNEDLMPSLNDAGDEAALHRWGVNGNIGYEF